MRKSMILLLVAVLAIGAQAQVVTTVSQFNSQIAAYATAIENVEVVVGQNLTLNVLVNILAPATEGCTLTIRSANPAAPVILTRGVMGDLFTVSAGATLILENIIVDGARKSTNDLDSGPLVVVVQNGTLVMNSGEIRNNYFYNQNSQFAGGGVHIFGGTFTMNDGKISGNNGNAAHMGFLTAGGGVHVSNSGTFIMNGGEISGNNNSGVRLNGSEFIMNGGEINGSVSVGNGIFTIYDGKINGSVGVGNGIFTMNGGEINGNTEIAVNVNRLGNGTFNMNGGVVFGTGTIAVTNLNISAPNNGIIISFNRSNTVYTEGTNFHLTTLPDEVATATWAIEDGKSGISYENGANVGFIEMPDITVIPQTGEIVTVSTVGDFNTFVGSYAIRFDDFVIEVDEDLTLNSLLNIRTFTTEGRTVTIRSANPSAPAVLTRGIRGDLFTVSANNTLILENIIIDGARDGGFPASNSSLNGPLLIVNRDGKLVMDNGAVVRNNASIQAGGVLVSAGGVFTMTGGEISHNSGSGVWNGGEFTMNNGKINGNYAVGERTGGGVCGTFIMNGGEISGNSGRSGGGVYGSLTMNGGEISGNSAGEGGGVYGSFTMNGGEISGNTAGSGGGVYATFLMGISTMNGGKISGNTAGHGALFGGGGGVYVNATFNMTGGIISNNTSGYEIERGGGAGVYVHIGYTFTMSGGEISGNNDTHGDGTYTGVFNFGTFTMNGGVIISSHGTYPAGGVHIAGGIFTMNDGVVVGMGGVLGFVNWIGDNRRTDFNDGVRIGIDFRNTSIRSFVEGTNTRLTSNARAVWAIDDGRFGISYERGTNIGFIEIAGVTVRERDESDVSVLSPNRVIPPNTEPNKETAQNTLTNALTSEFTAGPNPVNKQSDIVNFFWQGKGIKNAKLSIYDASGNLVKKIDIRDEAIGTQERRPVGFWDLKDSKGRAVSEGTYLVRGVVITSDGNRERVSIMIGIR